MTGQPLPAPSTVAVSVQNGTGTYNQAADTASALSALGFNTTPAGDVTPAGDLSETVVYYGSRASATEAAAEAVSRSMSGAVIMAYDPTQVTTGAEVTVVTGSQFAVSTPTRAVPPPTATTGAGGSPSWPSSAPSTTTTTSANVATASASTTELQPWDPRACTARATPTAPVANQT